MFVFQLLTTTGGVKARPSGGIVTELEDVEARMETYHMLRSFLTLIENLCETSGQPPESLGAGYRSPGFHPYLEFIISNVIMKLNSRNYKNKYEKVGLYHLVNGTSFWVSRVFLNSLCSPYFVTSLLRVIVAFIGWKFLFSTIITPHSIFGLVLHKLESLAIIYQM